MRKGRCSEIGREYFITTVTWQRQRLFRDFHVARLLIAELRELQEAGGVFWLAWVVMPDHFHGLVRLDQGDLSTQLNLMKGRSARRIRQRCPGIERVWLPGFYDHALRAQEDRKAIARYIVANPLRAGLAREIGGYPHWDVVWL